MLYWIVLALAVVAISIYTVRRGPEVRVSDVIFKIAASMMFVLIGVVSFITNPVDVKYGLLVVFGLCFGVLGDIFIDLKSIYPQHKKIHLNSGFIFFILEHTVLISAILIGYPMTFTNFLICLICPAVALVVARLYEGIFKIKFGEFRTISYFYTAFLFMTISVGFMTMTTNGFGLSQILFFVGGVLFFASDAVLSSMFFKEGRNIKPLVVANHLLYYPAQVLIASSLFFIK